VALHHLVVWLIVPASVFNYDAQWWVVLVHAAFVVLETIAACYISRSFFDNVIGLEKIVQARTATIQEKQRDMRLILDNVETGLVTIGLDGGVSSECSRVVEKWFGAPAAGEKLAAWLGKADAAYGEWLELGLEGVRDGLLPQEVALAQLPKALRDKERSYAVSYQLIADPAAPKILVIVTDITQRLRNEAAERYQAELLQLFQHIMRDKAGFIEFLAEAEDMIQALKSGKDENLEHVKRLVHTLKGNCAIFGMRRLSELCHEIESRIDEEAEFPAAAEMAGIYQAWTQVRSDLAELIGEHRSSFIEIDDADYRAILDAVRVGVGSNTVMRMIESWRLEPASRRLARIEQQIKGLAQRMGKSDVAVETHPHNLRLSNERFAPFWSAFIHVLRNAVDHGIEDGEQRRQSGKPQSARIQVSTALEKDRFVVMVQDDGPGVDWATLKAKATKLGVAPNLLQKRENLVFLPGVSSKNTVTELSGRGFGMVAVRDACEALGGTVFVASEPGHGTRVSFSFPKTPAIYEGHAALLRRAGTPVAA